MTTLPQDFLSLSLQNITPPEYIVSVCETTKLQAAIDILKSVSSCPVRKSGASDQSLHASSFIGMIDIIDIVAFFLEVNNTTKNWDRGFEQVLETVVQFTDHTVGDIINKTTLRHASVPFTTTIGDALSLLGPKKTHRLLVLDNDSKIINIVSQSTMLNFIVNNCCENEEFSHLSQALFDTPLSQIDFTSTDSKGVIHKEPLIDQNKQLLTIKASQKAIDAFQIIYSKRVTGVAIVDENNANTIIGNISSRDIRLLVGKSENFENLYSTAREYLELVKKERENALKNINSTALSRVNSARDDMNNNRDVSVVAVHSPISPCDNDIEVSANTNSVIAHAYNMIQTHSQLPAILTVSPSDTLGYVTYCLAKNHVRRVYLISSRIKNGKTIQVPYGIVTISDLMQLFAPQ